MTLKASTECDGCGCVVPGEDRRTTRYVELDVEMFTFRGYEDSRSVEANDLHVCSAECAEKVLDKLVIDFKKIVAEELVKEPPT